MRRSITLALSAHCSQTGHLGLAFISTDPPDKALTFQANQLAGQCLQVARPQTELNRKTLALMAKGLTPKDALQGVLEPASKPGDRLVLAMATDGKSAGHTGTDLKASARHGWTGHLCKDHCAVIAFGVPKKKMAEAALSALSTEATSTELLSDRLIRTLIGFEENFESPGLPLISAGIFITGDDPYPLLDLRVDMCRAPAARLSEIYDDYMAEDIREDALLPTAEHPHGIPPTGWGETKRYTIRKWREARRRWHNRKSPRT